MLLSCNQRALRAVLSPISSPSRRVCRSLEPLNGGIDGFFPRFPFSKFSYLSIFSSQCSQRSFGIVAVLGEGKGFGKKSEVVKKKNPAESLSSPGSVVEKAKRSDFDDGDEAESIPEVVTNRMLKRITLTVGVPLAFGLLLFPLFYYTKAVLKWDVPEWLPLLASLLTFSAAGLGIGYGVVSSSWDPAREGSLLGWKEAQVNWPLMWDKMQRDKEARR